MVSADLYNGNNCTVVVVLNPLLSLFGKKSINKCLNCRIIGIFFSDCNDVCVRAVLTFAKKLV